MDNYGILQAPSKPLAGGPELDHRAGLFSSTAIVTNQNLERLTAARRISESKFSGAGSWGCCVAKWARVGQADAFTIT